MTVISIHYMLFMAVRLSGVNAQRCLGTMAVSVWEWLTLCVMCEINADLLRYCESDTHVWECPLCVRVTPLCESDTHVWECPLCVRVNPMCESVPYAWPCVRVTPYVWELPPCVKVTPTCVKDVCHVDDQWCWQRPEAAGQKELCL